MNNLFFIYFFLLPFLRAKRNLEIFRVDCLIVEKIKNAGKYEWINMK